MRIVKVAQVITGLLSIALWFSSFGLFFHFDAVNPVKPDTASGAIYAQVNHGHVVYLTAVEKNQWYALMGSAGLLLVICAGLSLHLWLIKRSRSPVG